ncbi:MAG: hypothetical protein JW915_15175 [Chitinispirillaceae bacterium]|nr:hypothetical protein [Chitinispirillaceae bacterium]
MKTNVIVIGSIMVCLFVLCNEDNRKIQLNNYDNVELIPHGLDYPRDWNQKADNCHCGNTSNREECKLFCNALESVNSILCLPREKTLRTILKDMTMFARDVDNGNQKVGRFVGASVLLYFYNSIKEDEIIRKHLRNDTNSLKLIFASHGRIVGFGWIYNRLDKTKWASMIAETKMSLFNPFEDSEYKKYFCRDSIQWCTPLIALECEMEKTKK